MQMRLVFVLDNPENFVTIVAYGLHDVILGWLHGWNVRKLGLIRIDGWWFSRYLRRFPFDTSFGYSVER